MTGGAAHPPAPATEFVLGGQRSGKSGRAEGLAQAWLAASPRHQAVLLATGQAHDSEMQARIARHQQDRAQRLPALVTVETPLHLAAALAQHSAPDTVVVVDCLTLWLTNWLMPADGTLPPDGLGEAVDALVLAITQARGPLVLVGNEIGLGVIPMGAATRAFVDQLGWLNQRVAAACDRLTLMVAGHPVCVK